MVVYIIFSDSIRQEEIDTFYKACQMHRSYYKGYPKAYHPLTYFKEPEYLWQCPSEMSQVYLSFPPYHVKYKQPVVLPPVTDSSTVMPPLPGRTLGGRMNILFVDSARQDEIETFYEAAQRHRDYYRGYPKANNPLWYFSNPEFKWQCPPDMTTVYLSFPMYHVKYKQPVVLPNTTERTSRIPAMPGRTLAGRYNKAACQAFVR